MLIKTKPSVQRIPASGEWFSGDATFVGPNSTDDAVITYYQKKRHIFGDLKIEIFGEDGKLVDTVPTSKRRSLNRTTWSMRLKPPQCAGSGRGLWSRQRPPPLAGYVHRETDEGQAGLYHAIAGGRRPTPDTHGGRSSGTTGNSP